VLSGSGPSAWTTAAPMTGESRPSSAAIPSGLGSWPRY
jgi:hypothetical protein